MQKSLESYSSMVIISNSIPPLQNPTHDELLSSIQLEITENPSFSPDDSSESKPADDEKSNHETHQTVTEYSLQVPNKKRGEEDAHHQEKRACTTNTSSTVPTAKKSVGTTTTVEDDGGSGRERLKRHRVEVAGRVWIPDMWAQETCLKDWIDCTAFDASLVNSSIMSARDSLVEEARRANSSRLRILN